MKKIKQILCTFLAVAMIFGCSVVGVSATQTFSDADQIVHVEAVNRAAELGYFVGSNGKFMPKDTVTRAQMATVIVKMLHGADFNANPYKNKGKFNDTADFQGGWADGYINLCAEDGVVGGYGGGIFKPGQQVNAGEAVTMLLNALDIDAGAGNWPDTVMNKGTELGFFDELEGVVAGTVLNRDQLAALVIAGVDWKEEQAERPSNPESPAGSGGSSASGDVNKDDTTTPGGENETEEDTDTPAQSGNPGGLGGENETEMDTESSKHPGQSGGLGGENETEMDSDTPAQSGYIGGLGGENETEMDF